MPVWRNNDGLTIRTGTDEAKNANLYEYRSNGPRRFLGIDLNWANLPQVAENSVAIDYKERSPKGALIESGVIAKPSVPYASAGSAFLLNVGLADADNGTNILDVDALVVAATQTEVNAGGTDLAGWVGAAVGTVVPEAAVVTWEVDGARPTAGTTEIRIFYSIPVDTTDRLGT